MIKRTASLSAGTRAEDKEFAAVSLVRGSNRLTNVVTGVRSDKGREIVTDGLIIDSDCARVFTSIHIQVSHVVIVVVSK